EAAAIAEAVAVLDVARQDVRDRLDPAMRMPREAGQIVNRMLVAEIVQQQERIEVARVAEAERPAQLDARAFERRLRLDDAFDWSNRHECSSFVHRLGLTIFYIVYTCQVVTGEFATLRSMAKGEAHPPALCVRFHRASELIGRRWTGAIIYVLLGTRCRF